MYRIIGADGKEYGPVSAEQLGKWVAEGRANAETRIVAEGWTEWKPLGSFAEFSPWFGKTPPPSPLTTPSVSTGLIVTRKTNAFAVCSLVLGVLAWTAGFCCYGIPLNVIGVVFSLVALFQIKESPRLYDGKGIAIAGLILSASSLALGAFLFLAPRAVRIWPRVGHHIYRL
jgi:hypothetical protein